jgi:hypothetical protein
VSDPFGSHKEARTAKEHVAWAKERALELLEQGNRVGAWNSLCSDLKKHSETQQHPALELGMMLLLGGHLSSGAQMREFIEGFN